MNIWKLTATTTEQKVNLLAVAVALTPEEARGLLRAWVKAALVELDEPIAVKQLGTAATNLRAPELITVSIL